MDPKIRAKIVESTQDHLEIKDIVEDIVLTKSGSAALVLQTSAVNFDLLSEFEQDNKIYAFAGLLNSLNFHIQIMIRTRRIDISTYIDYLKEQEKREISPGLKKQLEIYTLFIQNLIVQNDVLDKNFFIIIPYSAAIMLPNVNILEKKKNDELIAKQEAMAKEKLLEQAKMFLYPKRDHILKQIAKIGLDGHQLTNKELLAEFYTLYNPVEKYE
jgi:hypothetical protein